MKETPDEVRARVSVLVDELARATIKSHQVHKALVSARESADKLSNDYDESKEECEMAASALDAGITKLVESISESERTKQ